VIDVLDRTRAALEDIRAIEQERTGLGSCRLTGEAW
jgi:hypothetical protein